MVGHKLGQSFCQGRFSIAIIMTIMTILIIVIIMIIVIIVMSLFASLQDPCIGIIS